MALLILIITISSMILLARVGKRAKERESRHELSKVNKKKDLFEHQRTQKEVDELITVILPTIDSSK